MVAIKGVETALRAAQRTLRLRSDVTFLFVGDGAELPRYRQLAIDLGIAHSVIFTGTISNPTDAGVFDASDIYCQPSIWQEASGLAVLEAMSFRLPVVASDTGGLPENVRRGETGILVPPGDEQKLSEAIVRLLDLADYGKKMGEAGYGRILREHRIEDTARKYADIFLARAPETGQPASSALSGSPERSPTDNAAAPEQDARPER